MMFDAAPPPAPPAAEAIAPGYWEITERVVGPFPKVEKRCIRPAEVAQFMQGPHNHNYACTYPVRVVTSGTIRLEGSCKSRHSAPVPVSGHGSFTPNTFHMEARIVAHMAGLDVPLHASTDARRIAAECPSGG